jgi:hypothetical protein
MCRTRFKQEFPSDGPPQSTRPRGNGYIPIHQKNAKDLITYFLYNLRHPSSIRDKVEVSIIYTQMEVGSFSQFLTIPYETFGHLAAMVTCVQLWRNTEPFGLHMCPAESVSWTPTLIAPGDQSLM